MRRCQIKLALAVEEVHKPFRNGELSWSLAMYAYDWGWL